MALVRDPWFWKRFSRAVHLDEEVRSPTEKGSTIWSNHWLTNHHRKRRRSFLCGCAICVVILIVIAALAAAIWWFCAHNWLHEETA
ncbi:uncharacterized protein BJX67DRAFT_383364 [Aspergillus lucknowensis]|uniref:Uncharacterized protein n=1 Tax=Aspergillus lucknowensis TaxID=176173 RepID=A0ABR4LK83_9EURO